MGNQQAFSMNQHCALSFLKRWYRSFWPGLGLFGESYILFSVGILKPLWQILYPDCFIEFETCSPRLLNALSYASIAGIIVGMVVIGYFANIIGRRPGSILTASLMSIGAIGLTAITLFISRADALFSAHVIFLFIFGIGVGGEYPLAASIASENSLVSSQEKDGIYVQMKDLPTHSSTFSRGQDVQLVFTMQGMGILANCMVFTLLLACSGQTNDQYSSRSLLLVWQSNYAVGTIILLYVLVSRTLYSEESEIWKTNKELLDTQKVPSSKSFDVVKKLPPPIEESPSTLSVNTGVSSLSAPSVVAPFDDFVGNMSSESTDEGEIDRTSLILRMYGVRLLGVCASWFLWDISFYGNKLFQSSFLLTMTGEETSLLQFAGASTLNAAVALVGYLGAALLLDTVGRSNLQSIGFFVTGVLFIFCGLGESKLGSNALVFLYLASTFFGQLGPNATTFLLPAEAFPTDVRTLCHGLAAASGKVGALSAAVLFNYTKEVDMFLISGYTSFVACVITIWAIPETRKLDLKELDKQWLMALEGKRHQYSGPANSADFLSLFEKNKVAFKHRAGNFSVLDIET